MHCCFYLKYTQIIRAGHCDCWQLHRSSSIITVQRKTTSKDRCVLLGVFSGDPVPLIAFLSVKDVSGHAVILAPTGKFNSFIPSSSSSSSRGQGHRELHTGVCIDLICCFSWKVLPTQQEMTTLSLKGQQTIYSTCTSVWPLRVCVDIKQSQKIISISYGYLCSYPYEGQHAQARNDRGLNLF